jgi:hypothetical protein
MSDKDSRRVVGWLLVFLYFSFLYTYGAKLSTLLYTDFYSFYFGAKRTFVSHKSPYDGPALQQMADKAEPPKTNEKRRMVYPYLYPPPSLLLFSPMARLHIGAAKLELLIVNHACLLAVIAMLLIPIAGFKPRELLTLLPAALVIYILYSQGTFETIELGQVNFIVLAMLCLAWWALKRDGPAWAIGLPLGIACIFKIYPVLFLALLAMRRKWSAVYITLGVLIVMCGVTFIPHIGIGYSLWHQWIVDVAGSSGYLKYPMATASKPEGLFPPTLAGNVGLAGFMARLFLPPRILMEEPLFGKALLPHANLGRLLTYLIVAGIVCVTTIAAGISSRKSQTLQGERGQRINLEFSAFLILTFLVAPLAWEHHLAYVMPAVVIALLTVLRDRPESRRNRTAIFIFAIACIIGWPMRIGKLPLPLVVQLLAISLKLYAVLALWIFILLEMLRSTSPQSAPHSSPPLSGSDPR